ncbi:MAG: gfo/Idh/MocA family oxidoreductase, partial [Verrucomicrobiae bacterium]|nr:gfo/Idh/MocA family oxidoreductase [Verrucomicrobiae bacterium]
LENYRRAVEIVESGVIGPVRECHVWANAIYTGGHFTTNTSAPQNVDWDLWLGPAPQRPYSEGVHPFHWRRFWDYGTGSLGDFGCHFMDLPHWALKLRNPTSISAIGSSCDPVTTPGWCVVDYRYPARENLPPVQLTWYDSGMKPAQLAQLVRQQPKDQNGNDMNTDSGQMFVGEHGMLLTNYTQ